VGDDHQRDAEPAAQILHQFEDLGLDRDVERGCRLVGDHQRWLARERDRLVALGAYPRARVKGWWVMEDPSGNPFCLIRPESGLPLATAKNSCA
jgi:hypothetical protein